MQTNMEKGGAAENKNQPVIKVLIADDDLPTRMLLRAAVNQWGYEVVEASDGEEAWEILQKGNPPMLLVLDWLMPKTDGIELSKRIKQQLGFHPYVILLTQVTGTANIVKALEAGADEFLTKPFNMAELKSRLSVGKKILGYQYIMEEQTQQLKQFGIKSGESTAFEWTEHLKFLTMVENLIRVSKDISNEMNTFLLDICKMSQEKGSTHIEQVKKMNESLKNLNNTIKETERLYLDIDEKTKTPFK